MNQILAEPLFYILFIYGASFLMMSFVVFHGTRNATSIALVTAFYTLAGFGLTHGTAELIDWVRFILKTTGGREFGVLLLLSQIFMVISFFLLLQFGVNLLTYKSEKKGILRLFPAFLFAAYIVYLLIVKISDISKAGLIARHSFGFLGALLSGIAFLALSGSMRAIGNSKLTEGLAVTGVAFVCYSVFGGLIVDPVAGLPVQLFRAACAFTIAVSSFFILEVFKLSK